MTPLLRRLPPAATLALLASAPFALALASAGSTAPVADTVSMPTPEGSPLAAGDTDPAKVAKGRYLVTIAACNDCHTPMKLGEKGPEPDLARALSGHPQDLVMPPAPVLPPGPWQVVSSATVTAWNGPWGTSFTANLTPDEDTGLGLWTFENFRDTIRTGRHLGRGRAILPPMPIPYYSQFTDADLEAIYQYLRTVPAVSNRVPEPLPPPAPAAPVAAAE